MYWGKSENKYLSLVLLTTPDERRPLAIPDPARFDSWIKLIRSTAWILRLIHNYFSEEKRTGELRVFELKRAELLYVKQTQADEFPVEIKLLKDDLKKDSLPKESKPYKLSSFVDDDHVLRLKSRAKLSADMNDDLLLLLT